MQDAVLIRRCGRGADRREVVGARRLLRLRLGGLAAPAGKGSHAVLQTGGLLRHNAVIPVVLLGGNDPAALFDLLILAIEELAAALAGVVQAVARLRAGLLLGRGLVQLVAQRSHRGGLGGVAVLAGVGHHARLRAGGLRGHLAVTPRVGQQVAGGKGLRALRAAGAALIVRGLLGAGGRGGQIAVRGHFLIVSMGDQQGIDIHLHGNSLAINIKNVKFVVILRVHGNSNFALCHTLVHSKR